MSNASQFRVTAEYLREQGLSPSFPRRFFSKIQITESCWLWFGCWSRKIGYGMLSKWGRASLVNAHRASWILHFGPIPDELSVLHDCPDGDNKLCVNPAHLWLGNHKDNFHDSVTKGTAAIGERCIKSKVTESDVREIRRLYATGNYFHREIAALFPITRRAVGRIITRDDWDSVP